MPLTRITADTTAIWVDFFNNTHCPEIEALAGSPGGSIDLLGNGRIAGIDTSQGTPQATNALAVVIPDGTKYLIDGALKTAESDITITGVPAGISDGVYGVLSVAFDEDSQADIWSATWSVTKPDAGIGIIGKVTTDADKVVSIDATDEDIIQPEWVKQARLRAIESTPIVGGDTGGGGGGGTIGDATALQQMRKIIDGLVSRIEELEGKSGLGVVATMSFDERMNAEQMAQDLALVALNPNYAQDANESILWDGVTGNGENVSPEGNQPNVNPGGNEPIGG